ncbi:MAG: hypothetical protein EBU46_17985 [Nitrosomonadaceae bacterium]|nr:hypothetical protein [Nitrosomonadaceae bacterium]
MPVTRKDLNYAWLSQLAGLIEDDWDRDEQPVEASMLLKVMRTIQEPSGTLQTLACLRLLETLLPFLGGWQSDLSDMVVKEIKLRIYEYREQLKPAPPLGLRPVFTGIDDTPAG